MYLKFDKTPFNKLKSSLQTINQNQVFVITDDIVSKLVYPRIKHLLPINHKVFIVPHGETSKNWPQVEFLTSQLLVNKAGRDSILIGLGGGVITDLTGFVASIFMRGIPFILIPTSLLAQVDAAIGGKTAIDFNGIKNVLGTFTNPLQVWVIPELLQSLDQRNIRNGFAEMLKHTWLQGEDEFYALAKSDFNEIPAHKLVFESAVFKFKLVKRDFKESNIRKSLNAGHTIGHAIEAWSNNKHHIPLLHGEAIIWGMVLECFVAYKLNLLLLKYVETWFDIAYKNYYISEKFPGAKELQNALFADKKNVTSVVKFVAFTAPGQYVGPLELLMSDLDEAITWVNRKLDRKLCPQTFLNGTLTLPISKSIANRLLILSKLLNEPFDLLNTSESLPNDVLLLKNALESNKQEVNLADAGTAYRFFVAYAAFNGLEYTLFGTERMHMRPIKPLVDALAQMGAQISYINQDGFPPLFIKTTQITNYNILLDASLSSQFVSAILLLAPIFKENGIITFQTEPVSKPYIQITLSLLNKLGIKTSWSQNTLTIKKSEITNKSPLLSFLEPDWSAAAFWIGAAMLAKSSNILLKFLKPTDVQGDAAVLPWLQSKGLNAFFEENGLRIVGFAPSAINDWVFDAGLYPDWVPTLAVVCPLIGINITFNNIESLRIKESDRIEAITENLIKIGVISHVTQTQLRITATENLGSVKKAINIKTFNDHRIAMAFSLITFRGYIAQIDDFQVVNKSYPEFWKHFNLVCKN